MEVCPACGMRSSPLDFSRHRRSGCDGKTIQPHMRGTRPGQVRSISMRTSGTELRRIAAKEAHLILDSDLPVDLKLAHIREDIPYLTGKHPTASPPPPVAKPGKRRK